MLPWLFYCNFINIQSGRGYLSHSLLAPYFLQCVGQSWWCLINPLQSWKTLQPQAWNPVRVIILMVKIICSGLGPIRDSRTQTFAYKELVYNNLFEMLMTNGLLPNLCRSVGSCPILPVQREGKCYQKSLATLQIKM